MFNVDNLILIYCPNKLQISPLTKLMYLYSPINSVFVGV